MTDLDILKRVTRARQFARAKGWAIHADDFGQDVAVQLLQGRKTSTKNLWIDFLRNKYGDTSYEHGRVRNEIGKQKQITVVPVQPTQEHGASIIMMMRGRTKEQQELILLLSSYMFECEVAELLGITRGALHHRKRALLQSYARIKSPGRRCLKGITW